MSGSYSQLNQKYNTLYALYLELQQEIIGLGGDLQTVLDAGNTATDVPIILTSTNVGETSRTNTTDHNGMVLYDSSTNNKAQILSAATTGVTDRTITVLPDKINMGSSGVLQIRYKPNGIQTFSTNILDITTSNGMTLQGVTPTAGQVIQADSANNPVWATPPASTTPTIDEVLTAGYDAGFLSIINLNNIQIADGGGAPTNVELACNGTSLSLSTASVVGTKQFTGTYLPIYVDGEERFIQLFSDPP